MAFWECRPVKVGTVVVVGGGGGGGGAGCGAGSTVETDGPGAGPSSTTTVQPPMSTNPASKASVRICMNSAIVVPLLVRANRRGLGQQGVLV